MLPAELTEATRRVVEESGRLRRNAETASAECSAIVEGALAVSAMLDLFRVQQACLPPHHLFRKRDALPREGKATGATAKGEGREVLGERGGGKRGAARKGGLEEFRDKLPAAYRGDEAVQSLLRVRRFVDAETAKGGGATLASVREELGGGVAVSKVSQLLDVLVGAGCIERKHDKGASFRFVTAAGPGGGSGGAGVAGAVGAPKRPAAPK